MELNANLQWCNSKATFFTLWISFCMCKMPLSPEASSYVLVDDLTWSENIWPSPKISLYWLESRQKEGRYKAQGPLISDTQNKDHWFISFSVSGRKNSMRRMFLNLAEIHLPGVPAANNIWRPLLALHVCHPTQTEKHRHESFSLYMFKSLKRAKWFQQVILLLFILTNIGLHI